MACVLTQSVVDLKLSAPPSFHGAFALRSATCASTASSGGSGAAQDDEQSSCDMAISPMESTPLSLPRRVSLSSHSTASDASSPHSQTSPSLRPRASPSSASAAAAAAAAAGNSCHQCKTAKDASLLLFCSSAAEKGVRKRRCRKKYCDACLRRSYNPEVAVPSANWVCPSCAGFCVCAACSRGGEGELSKEKINGGLQTLAAMNPMILALLGIDERRIAHLHDLVNSPALSSLAGDSAALMAVMGAATGTHGVGHGMQELSLVHDVHPTFAAALPLGGTAAAAYGEDGAAGLHASAMGYERLAAAQGLRSGSGSASTVSSPYASSAYSSSSTTSSPLLRPLINGEPSTVRLTPASGSAGPAYSPRLVSRSHTHGLTHSPDGPHLAHPRALSHPSNAAPVCSSLPTPSRHLHDVEALEGSYQRELAVNRKRSWSSSLGEEEGALVGRSRFATYGGPDDFHSVKLEGQHPWSGPSPHEQFDVYRRLQDAAARDSRPQEDFGFHPQPVLRHSAEAFSSHGRSSPAALAAAHTALSQ